MNVADKIKEKEAEIKALAAKIEEAEGGNSAHSESTVNSWRAEKLELNKQLTAWINQLNSQGEYPYNNSYTTLYGFDLLL